MTSVLNSVRCSRSAAFVGRASRPSCSSVSVCCSSTSALTSSSTSRVAFSSAPCARPSPLAARQQQRTVSVCATPATPATGPFKLISRTEVPPFIPRDDMIDQLMRWATYEAGDSGVRNFGMPMKVEPTYDEEGTLWGYKVAIYKEGAKLTDLAVMFDGLISEKHEWVGRGEDGFPVMEGKVDEVKGKFFEIWKLDSNPVDEDLRGTIRAFCTGLVAALNRYYAFGSVFVDDAQ